MFFEKKRKEEKKNGMFIKITNSTTINCFYKEFKTKKDVIDVF